jgi:hypothetical protein
VQNSVLHPRLYFIRKTCCSEGGLCYIARSFPEAGRGVTKTINRQLFFVWLDNAFAFA